MLLNDTNKIAINNTDIYYTIAKYCVYELIFTLNVQTGGGS